MCGSLKGKLFHATKENIELKQEVAYLTACLKKTIFSEKIIKKDSGSIIAAYSKRAPQAIPMNPAAMSS